MLNGEDVDYDRNKMIDFLKGLGALGLSAAEDTRRIGMGVELARVARELGAHWSSQVARLQDPVFAIDRAEAKRKLADDHDFQRQTRLRAIAALTLPTEWQGKVYRRLEAAGDEKAREKAEEKERLRGAKRVMRVIEEARLPLQREMADRGLDCFSLEASRALRGLRGSTLNKRAADWAPFARWLKANKGRAWPEKPRDLLDYFEVRREEQAARTC